MDRGLRTATCRRVSYLLSTLAVLAAIVAAGVLLAPAPLADAFFAGIVSLGVAFAFVGWVGAWTHRTPLVWAGALLSTGLAILGLLSVGFLFAPASLLLLGAAVFAQLAGPRADVRAAIVADPPTERELAQKRWIGVGAVVAGIGLVYIGAFTRELFGACARETLACALDVANWGAIGVTVLGLAAVGYGAWLCWKQAYTARVLAATRTR